MWKYSGSLEIKVMWAIIIILSDFKPIEYKRIHLRSKSIIQVEEEGPSTAHTGSESEVSNPEAARLSW